MIHRNSHLLRSIRFSLSPRCRRSWPGDAERRVAMLDLLLRCDGDDQVAGRRAQFRRQFLQPLGAEILLERRRNSLRRHLHGVHATRARAFCEFGKLVELFARPRCRSGRNHRLNVAFDMQHGPRWLEMLRHVVQFHPETQVGLVRAVAAHRVLVIEVAERAFRRDADDRARPLHHALDGLENILLARKRHLEVKLREFGLAVGAKVLVAKTADDLIVAVHAGDHQDLLEDLRRLRQRVKLPVMDAARHEIIARAFGRRAREHRRLDLEEALLVERFADFEDDAVPQLDIRVQPRAAQIEIAVAQPRLFARGYFVFDRETAASSSCSTRAGAWLAPRPRPWRFRDSTSACAGRVPRQRPRTPIVGPRPWRAPRGAAPC